VLAGLARRNLAICPPLVQHYTVALFAALSVRLSRCARPEVGSSAFLAASSCLTALWSGIPPITQCRFRLQAIFLVVLPYCLSSGARVLRRVEIALSAPLCTEVVPMSCFPVPLTEAPVPAPLSPSLATYSAFARLVVLARGASPQGGSGGDGMELVGFAVVRSAV